MIEVHYLQAMPIAITKRLQFTGAAPSFLAGKQAKESGSRGMINQVQRAYLESGSTNKSQKRYPQENVLLRHPCRICGHVLHVLKVAVQVIPLRLCTKLFHNLCPYLGTLFSHEPAQAVKETLAVFGHRDIVEPQSTGNQKFAFELQDVSCSSPMFQYSPSCSNIHPCSKTKVCKHTYLFQGGP